MGVEKVLVMLKGGHKKFQEVLMRYLVVVAILKGGHEMFYPVLRGDAKGFGPAIFPFCNTPPPITLIYDKSLKKLLLTTSHPDLDH